MHPLSLLTAISALALAGNLLAIPANLAPLGSATASSAARMKIRHGSELRQIFSPMERVGVYVPGGKAVYPSTVLMNVIPAQVAGVQEIHLVSPPDKTGMVHPDVLVAAGMLGVSNIYCVGGAQAIAALASLAPAASTSPTTMT